MRIGVEAWAAAEVPAGRGRYLRELLAHMAAAPGDHELVLYGRTRWDDPRLGDGVSWRTLRGTGWAWLARCARAAARDCDVLLAPTSYALCALARLPTVGVVFDLVVFDGASGAPRGAAFERLTLPLAVRRAAALLCISEATRDALVARLPAAASIATVTPLAADAAFARAAPDPEVRSRLGLERPYVLSTATLEPRKNLPRLIQAFAALEDQVRRQFDLVLVGSRGWRTEELEATIRRHQSLVRPLGFVADADLPAVYAGAEVVAYPSLHEGFGLPVLEAMAAGAPVLTSNRSSLPEVGGEAAYYVDPTDVTSIRDGLMTLLGDEALRTSMRAAGRQRAAMFSWERTAAETLDVLQRVAVTSRA